MLIYIAGPLFSIKDRAWIEAIDEELHEAIPDISVFKPYDECEGLTGISIFNKCIEGINKSDIIIATMDGSSVDDGTAFECGYAYANAKNIFGIRTDFRNSGDTEGTTINAMLGFSSRMYTDMRVMIEDIKILSEKLA